MHNLKDAWKWLSVQLSLGLGLLALASEYMPQIKENLPEGWAKYAFLAILAARLYKQGQK